MSIPGGGGGTVEIGNGIFYPHYFIRRGKIETRETSRQTFSSYGTLHNIERASTKVGLEKYRRSFGHVCEARRGVLIRTLKNMAIKKSCKNHIGGTP